MNNSIHPETKLGELKLKVSNLERSLTFYQEVIGFKVLKQDGRVAELTADGRTVLLVLEEVPNAYIVPQRSSSGLYHFAILLPTRKDLGLSLKRLIDAGMQVGQADHNVSEALYLSDPDQNGIEIYRDRPRTEWEYDSQGNVKMTTDPIDWQGVLEEARGSEWQGLSDGTTIGHVHFHVGDLQKAKHFYCDVLGFDIEADLMKQMGALFISAGRYHHHIALNVWAGNNAPVVPSNGTGIAYFTIVLPNEEELIKTVQGAVQAGFEAEQKLGFWYVKDPSDIFVKLTIVS